MRPRCVLIEKTSRPCAAGAAIEPWEILPRSGTMHNGIVYPLDPSAPLTCGTAFFASRGMRMFPTPAASDGTILFDRHYSREALEKNFRLGGQRNAWNVLRFLEVPIHRYPHIYEWLMDFPQDWTRPH